MFNKHISITIPFNDEIKTLTAKYDKKNISSIGKIQNINSLHKLKIMSLNCRHVILIPAEKLYLASHSLKKEKCRDVKVAEDSFCKNYNRDNIDLINEYYYDSINFSDPENEENLNLKILAAEKDYIDSITERLDRYPNNYMVTALPAALYSLSKKFIKKDNYIFYYKTGNCYSIIVNYKNTLDLIRSGIKKQYVEREVNKSRKNYLNRRSTDMEVIEGNPDLFNLDNLHDMDKDGFVFLASLLWGVSKWQ
ncbi:MAG: hypothetical protein ACQESS_08385 [Bacillota bacterium]